MDTITIRISATDQGGYMYDIWKGDQISDAAPVDSEDGGQCTSTMSNALEMAMQQAKDIIRNENSGNAFNPEICPSSLDDCLEPMTEGETAHTWDETASPVACSECGATRD